MATAADVLADLKAKGTEKTRLMYVKHGAPAERTLGVSTPAMKAAAKSLRKQQDAGYELYASGIFEAMYVAGMVCDGRLMAPELLERWAVAAEASMIAEYTVPWVARSRTRRRVSWRCGG